MHVDAGGELEKKHPHKKIYKLPTINSTSVFIGWCPIDKTHPTIWMVFHGSKYNESDA